MALLLLLHDLHGRGEVVLDCAAHLNHRIRGDAADADEAFCRALTGELGVAFVAERVDVPALAQKQRLSIEVAARQARREFLERVRASRGADRIATAHTADDQAETVLLRLVRGAGTRGLGGIAPRRGGLDPAVPRAVAHRASRRAPGARPVLVRGRDQRRPQQPAESSSPRRDPAAGATLQPVAAESHQSASPTLPGRTNRRCSSSRKAPPTESSPPMDGSLRLDATALNRAARRHRAPRRLDEHRADDRLVARPGRGRNGHGHRPGRTAVGTDLCADGGTFRRVCSLST